MNESELFKKYKSSYKSAFLDLSIHTFYLSSAFYLLWFFRDSWLYTSYELKNTKL